MNIPTILSGPVGEKRILVRVDFAITEDTVRLAQEAAALLVPNLRRNVRNVVKTTIRHVWINVPALRQKQTITDILTGVPGHRAHKLVVLDGAFAPESVNAKE